MSLAFAQFLEEQDINWNRLSDAERMELRRLRTRHSEFEESKVVESEVQSVDLKQIIARHVRNQLPYQMEPWWQEGGDATLAPSLQDALETVRRANESFDALPADVRFRFANDPVVLARWIGDESNKDEAIRLGLIPKPEPVPVPPDPIRVQVVADPQS